MKEFGGEGLFAGTVTCHVLVSAEVPRGGERGTLNSKVLTRLYCNFYTE